MGERKEERERERGKRERCQTYCYMCMLATNDLYFNPPPVLKAGHSDVPFSIHFVCLGYGWAGYFTFLIFCFVKASVLCTCVSMPTTY